MKMTSAYANKLLKSLADEKSYWTNKEGSSARWWRFSVPVQP